MLYGTDTNIHDWWRMLYAQLFKINSGYSDIGLHCVEDQASLKKWEGQHGSRNLWFYLGSNKPLTTGERKYIVVSTIQSRPQWIWILSRYEIFLFFFFWSNVFTFVVGKLFTRYRFFPSPLCECHFNKQETALNTFLFRVW